MQTILSVLNFLFILVEVLFIFNVIIIVHELGHFLAARWRGLVIEGFGVWFGKPIWKKTIGGVQYSLGSIPAGGFVKLPQMAPMDIIEGDNTAEYQSLPRAKALDKIIVAFAGPLFSFGLALALATLVWAIGRPVGESEATTTIGYVLPDSPAAKAGLQPGDQILEVDGKPVARFGGMAQDSITWRIVRSEGDTIPIKVRRGGQELTLYPVPLKPEGTIWHRKSLRAIQIMPAETPMVGAVEPNSPGEKAGLKANDLVTEVNGERLLSIMGIDDYAKAHPDSAITLTVMRDGQTLHIPFDVRGAKVDSVMKNSPAELVKIKSDNVITSVNGQPVRNQIWLTGYIHQHPGEPLALGVQRGTETFTANVTPAVPERGATVPMIGVGWGDLDGISWDATGKFTLHHPRPGEQIRAGVMAIVNTLDAVISKKSSVKLQHMNGPVTIMRAYYVMFESKEGWRLALWFSVIFNVNLAVLNMLPIPVLDGGHITLALLEAARRKPVNLKLLETIQSGCAVALIGFMIYIAFFDVQDLFGGGKGKREGVEFAAPAAEKR